MTTEDNVATYRRWFEQGWGGGRVDLVDELYSHDYVTHALGPDFPPTGEGLKMFTGAFRQGFPDLSCAVEEVIAEGDRVAGRLTLRGTHRGTLLGIPATGKEVVVTASVIARFDEAGKWVEDWANWDQVGMLQQLGVIPAPAAAYEKERQSWQQT